MSADEQRPIAVFDFDHTLVSMDSGTALLRELIVRSPWRAALAILALPFAAPLLLWQRTRLTGISIFLWLATAGRRAREFERSSQEFADSLRLEAPNAKVLLHVLQAFRAHLDAGHRVVVVSGSFQPLVARIMGRLTDEPVQVIGSSVREFCRGLVGERHCHGEEKIRMLLAAGVPDREWEYGYSDSAFDIPLLRRCARRYLVNPSPRTVLRYRKAFGEGFEILR